MSSGSSRLIMANMLLLMGTLVTGSERNKRDGMSQISPHQSRWPDVSSSWGGQNRDVFGSSQYPKYTVPEYMLHPIPKYNRKQQRDTEVGPGSHNRMFRLQSSASQRMHNQNFPSSNNHVTDVSGGNLFISPWNSPSSQANKQSNKANMMTRVNSCQPCSCDRPTRILSTQQFRHGSNAAAGNQRIGFQITKPTITSLKLGPPLIQQMPLFYEVGNDVFGGNAETSTHSSGEVTR